MARRVLLIEDDPDIQKMVSLSLRFKGNEVTVADGGAEGLRLALEIQPDVILLDVMMPDMDGHETLKKLKATPGTRHLPVVFLSARAQHSEVQRGLDMGAMGYLVKPFDPMTLADQLEALLSGRNPG